MPSLFRIVFVFIFTLSAADAADTVVFSHARISAAPPTVKVLAGYVTIHNQSDEPLDLISAHSPAFEKIEFHNTVLKDGVASMVKQEVIHIPAKSEVSFAPGGMHLMLFNKLMPLNSGDTIMLDLVFSNGASMPVEFELGQGDTHEHHHH